MRRYAVLALIAAAFALGPQPALACSCAAARPADQGASAAVVFSGTATAKSGTFPFSLACTRSSADPVLVTFGVDTVFKGDVGRSATVGTVVSGASCGFEFVVGRRYTVFATGTDGRLETNLCRGNVEGDIAPAEYGLAAGRPPR